MQIDSQQLQACSSQACQHIFQVRSQSEGDLEIEWSFCLHPAFMACLRALYLSEKMWMLQVAHAKGQIEALRSSKTEQDSDPVEMHEMGYSKYLEIDEN